MELKQYQIVLINLDPTIGSEMKKTRPCVIISPNEMNKFLKTIIIAPMTSNLKAYPTRIQINYDKRQGSVVLDQIRTVYILRVVKLLDALNEKDTTKVKKVLKETYVD